MLQYVPAPPANGSFSAAAGTSVTGTLVGVGIGGTAPVWNATPSLSVTATQSGFAGFSFTGTPTSVTVEPGDTLPGWVSAVTVAGISWNTTAVAGSTYSFRLRATNAFGYSTSSTISGTVASAPASSGFFAGWNFVPHTAVSFVGDNDNGPSEGGKQSRMIPHPNGRNYYFGGDTGESGQQRTWSLNPGTWNTSAPSSGWRLEHPKWPLSGNSIPNRTDCQATVWDSKRRIFWLMAGYSAGEAAGKPADVTGFQGKVAKFDPAKPQGTQWTPTATNMQQASLASPGVYGGERFGGAVYDPVLDLVFHGNDLVAPGQLHAFDPTTETFAFKAYFTQPNLEIPQDGWMLHAIAFDAVNRWLWVMRSAMGGIKTRNLYRVTLPNTRAGLPTNGSFVDWTSRATEIWNNPSTGLDFYGASCAVIDGTTRKWYGWLRGPIGAAPGAMGGGLPWGNNFQYGGCGHPIAGNGSFGSANTGALVDLMTGVVEYTQVPHMQYEDGQGWIIPTQTYYNAKHGRLIYFAVDEAGTGIGGVNGIAIKHNELRRKALPSWVPSTQFQWATLPQSTCETSLPTAIRNRWAGAEPAGSACEMTPSANAQKWSRGTIRQKDSILLFHSGGGQNGRGNGILGFQLNADTGSSDYGWKLVLPPTPRSKCVPSTALGEGPSYASQDEFNRDFVSPWPRSTVNGQETPVAHHAYSSAQYLDSRDMWLRFGTHNAWPSDGGNFKGVHGFEWSEMSKPQDSRLWSLNAFADKLGTSSAPPDSHLMHPWREEVYYGFNGAWRRWKHVDNSHSGLMAGGLATTINSFAAIDPVNDVMLHLGTPGSVAPFLIDLAADITSAGCKIDGNATASWTGSGAASFIARGRGDLSCVWDDDNACIWVVDAVSSFSGSTFALWKLVLSNKATCTWTVTQHSVSGSVPTLTGQDPESPQSVFWSRELGGIVLTQGYQKPVSFLKTSNRF